MKYTNIPFFENTDYQRDIREKIFVPLIGQHNEHSASLEILEPLVPLSEELAQVAGKCEELSGLADNCETLVNLSSSSEEISKLVENAEVLHGLDGRVLKLELGEVHRTPVGGPVDLEAIREQLGEHETKIEAANVKLGEIEVSVTDHETRIKALEDAPPGEGGNGGDVDLGPILERLDSLETADESTASDITAIEASVVDVKGDITSITSRVEDLENAPPGEGGGGSGPKEPTKFYVLPMGGQSNCVGYGETPYNINGYDNVNPRIKQLGRYATHDTSCNDLLVTEAKAAYGDRFDELRPYADCNLKIIPATPCLDHIQNMFQHNRQGGGTVSSGMYVARALLPYIPEDYGILIVPSAYGGTGFTSGTTGSWNQSKLRAENPRKHGADTPMGKDLYYRTKYALEQNPENVLLPFIWVQGENDKANHKGHYDGFKAFFEWFKSKFEQDNLQRFLPEKRMDNFRWFCLGATKWMIGANTETDYVSFGNRDWEAQSGKDVLNRLSTYNNYAFLSSKYKTNNGSQLVYVRADVDEFGKFVETNREHGTGNTSSQREIHFSTKGYFNNQAKLIVNTILRHSPTFTIPGQMFTRPVLGGLGNVSTDNVINIQHIGSDFSGINEGLLVYQEFTSGSTSSNKATGSSATISAGSAVTLVNDAVMGKAASFPGNSNNSNISYTMNRGNVSWTKSITFKASPAQRDQAVGWLLCHASQTKDGIIVFLKNSIVAFPNYTGGARNSSLLVSAAVEQNWNGDLDSWNTVTVTYSREAKTASAYLNGNLLQTTTEPSGPTLNGLRVGNANALMASNLFKGLVGAVRIYERALSHEEVRAIAHVDLLSKL